jgi:hypothetical protein
MMKRITCILMILLTTVLAFGAHRPAASRPLMTADDWVGRWRGTYVCNQGVTGLQLTVRRSETGEVAAVFSFFPVPENPDVPDGAFDMSGKLGPQRNRLQLFGRMWINAPPRYLMVGLDGVYDEATGEYSGSVDGVGCTKFILRRDVVS